MRREKEKEEREREGKSGWIERKEQMKDRGGEKRDAKEEKSDSRMMECMPTDTD